MSDEWGKWDDWGDVDQVVDIYAPHQKGSKQRVRVNPPGGRPPVREARGTAHLVVLALLVIVGLFMLIVACGVASALNTGAIW